MSTYKKAGVDIQAGDQLVDAIKPMAKRTQRPGSLSSIGGFGAVFDIKATGYQDPLLVSTTDGVGTKILMTRLSGNWQGIGQDLVAMCVNDLLVQGAEPLYFLDYYATGKLDTVEAAAVIDGIAQACEAVGCTLAGGETAEMPGLYQPGHFDLAGFAVGVVERHQLLPQDVQEGDVVLGLASSGPHSNGFSLIRKILENVDPVELASQPSWCNSTSILDAIVAPTRLYVSSVLPLVKQNLITAACHITGGGLAANFSRVLPTGLGASITLPSRLPSLFGWLQRKGNVSTGEMLRVFNCGVGFLVVTRPHHQQRVVEQLTGAGEHVETLGRIHSREPGQSVVTVSL
jgi:phosphoribosylformylglycinamidine cyclo-ligase